MKAAPTPLRKTPTYLRFEAGQCTGLLTPNGDGVTVQELVSRGLLSITDRMILNQIAERVERMRSKIEGEGDRL